MPNSQPALTALGNALFTGIETKQWSLAQFAQVARLAKGSGIDSLVVKVADGTDVWHGGLAGFTTIRNTLLQEGVGCLPYIYSYGNRFGGLSQELDIIEEYLNAVRLMCIDLEAEWNGQVDWAQQLNARLASNSNYLYISCMADPAVQNQNEVLRIIAPSVNVWMPQVYSDFLQGVWYKQFSNIGITSGFNVTYSLDPTSAGPNNALRSVKANQAHSPTVSIWEYQLAIGAQESLFKEIMATVKGWTTTETVTLANFPMVSQFDNDPNAKFDCVAGSIAAALSWLNHKKYTAAQVKDAAYGAAYIGDTAPAHYVNYCVMQGVALTPMNGTGRALVSDIRNELVRQHPVLITEPDPYLPGTGETHVCVAYSCGPTSITVMDPFIAQPVTKSDDTWSAQLQYNQIWTLSRKPQLVTTSNLLQLTDAQGAHFKETATSPTRWYCIKTRQNVIGAILTFYRQIGGAPRLPVSEAKYDIPNVVYQEFESGILVYDPQGVLDESAASFGPTYMLKLDSPLAQKLFARIPVER